MASIIVAILFLVGLGALQAADSGQRPVALQYTFALDLRSPRPQLHITLTFRGSRSGRTSLDLPSTWAGEHDLSNAIVNLHPTTPDTTLRKTDNPNAFILLYPPGRKVSVAYDLKQDWNGPLRHPREFRAVLQPTNLIVNGNNALVHPELGALTRVKASFKWRNVPSGLVIVTSFGIGTDHKKFAGNWFDIQNAFFAAGDFRISQTNATAELLTVAIRGSWAFSDAQARDELRSIFEIERAFWKDHRRASFLIVIAPYDRDLGSSDGTVLTKAFQLYLSRKQTFGVDEKSLLAHEVFHTWNPGRIGVPPNNGEETEWFTEGFTRYYQDRILLRARLLDAPKYLDRLNAIIGQYRSSPDRNWTQAQWLARTETHRAESSLPYDRGAVIALWLDEAIRRDSGDRRSLDDAMFALAHDKHLPRISTDSLLRSLSSDLSPADAAALRSFVIDGVTVPVDSLTPATHIPAPAFPR